MIWLVVFRMAIGSPGFVPDVIEQPFDNAAACWSVGFSMKSRDPKGIVWFSCERLND